MQTQPPVTPVTSIRYTRNDRWTTTTRPRRPYKGAGRVMGGGLTEATRNGSRDVPGGRRGLSQFGGQHRAPSGDTTRPTDAQFEWFQGEVQAAINSTDWEAPF